MVMPRSRSISIESSTCSTISRSSSPPVSWISRSASVDLPWSIWATIEKLRVLSMAAAVMAAPIRPRVGWGKDVFRSLLRQAFCLRGHRLRRRQYGLDDALHRLAQHRRDLEAELLGLGEELRVLHGRREGGA